ncbi:MAG: hypothetical protein J5I47_04630 [Vicingus serpentipes]|nr:hypothetical protein [Vicingus serpentipes]
MNRVKEIIKEELKGLLFESNYENNYGLPKNFNLLVHAEKLEEDKTRAENALTKIENIMMQDFRPNESKLMEVQKIIAEW